MKDFPEGRLVAEARGQLTRMEGTRWEAIRGSSNASDLERFLRDFPDARYAKEARRLLDLLRQVAVCDEHLQADRLMTATHCYQRIVAREPEHGPATKGLRAIAEHYYGRASEALRQARGHARSFDDAMLQVEEALRRLEGVDAAHPGLGELRLRLEGLRRGDEARLNEVQAELERLQGENERLRGETARWVRIQESNRSSDFEGFLSTYPEGLWAEAARRKLQDLKAAERHWALVKDSTDPAASRPCWRNIRAAGTRPWPANGSRNCGVPTRR